VLPEEKPLKWLKNGFLLNMITTTLVLLAHYPERDIENIEKIINAYNSGNVVPDKIIVFIDHPLIEFDFSDKVQIIRSNKSVSVIARIFASTFAITSHVILIDSDLMPKKDTLEKIVAFAEEHPNSVIGHEGVILNNSFNPYTSVNTHVSQKPEKCDVLIRSWFVPINVFSSALKMFWENNIPDKYSDDLLICLANKYINKKENYIIPVEFEELQTGGVGQCLSNQHYIYRDQICSLLMQKYL